MLENYTMEIQFTRNILEAILEYFDNVDSFNIAVAYIRKSGVDLVSDVISDKETKVFTIFDFAFTEPDALKDLLILVLKLKFIFLGPMQSSILKSTLGKKQI